MACQGGSLNNGGQIGLIYKCIRHCRFQKRNCKNGNNDQRSTKYPIISAHPNAYEALFLKYYVTKTHSVEIDL